ncbi:MULTISPECIES: glycosyltransferase family 2 protein [Schaalia]|uniref:glycosyltransferase family 2 protein n=1 Tax=Schaalia TaxID=2529408 RepID=UPI002A832610|nr:glycosyltransferase [Schaalia hyovaginalis]MDY4493016.1 glycosyltransferase [Schaalia hyovaginalis]
MKSQILAFIVARDPDSASRVLGACRAQTLAPDEILILDCSRSASPGAPATARLDGADPAIRTIATPGAKNLGDALNTAVRALDPGLLSARWWWILHDDSEPEATCLERLWEVADLGRTIAAAGPKQLDAQGAGLLEVGIEATSSARRLESILPGEIDQGQYDGRSDVLGIGTAGMLLDPGAWEAVGGFDSALGPFGDGLDFSRRLHRAGFRVVVVPGARIRHARASLIPRGPGSPALEGGNGGSDFDSALKARTLKGDPADPSFGARRFAQLYNWAKAVPSPLLPLLMAWLLLWTPLRALARLLSGRGRLFPPEITAWLRLIRFTPHLLVERSRMRLIARVPRSALRPLEVRGKRLRALKKDLKRVEGPSEDHLDDPIVAKARASYSARNAWVLALVLALASALAFLRWWGIGPTLAGGAWAAAPKAPADLWHAAFSWWIAGGDGLPGAPDPFLLPLALVLVPLGLAGIPMNAVLAWILVLALPAAAGSAWAFACRLTRSPGLRGATALTWTALPALGVSLEQGRLAPALFHVLLPLAAGIWVGLAAPAVPLRLRGAFDIAAFEPGRRSGALARFAILSAALVACVPWALLLVLVAVIVLLGRGGGRLALLVLIPSCVLLAPLAVDAVTSSGSWRALTTAAGPDAATMMARSWEVLLGLPVLESEPLRLILQAIPMVVLLISACLLMPQALRTTNADSARLGFAPAFIVLSALFLLLAAVVRRVDVGVVDSQVTTAWISPMLSLAALGLMTAGLLAAPTLPEIGAPGMRRAGRLGALLALCALAAGATPLIDRIGAASAPSDAPAPVSRGVHASAPLIAAVSEQGQISSRQARVLVLDADEGLARLDIALWRGAGPSLTDSTPLSRARALVGGANADPAVEALESAALALVVYPDEDVVADIAAHGVDTVLVPADSPGLPLIAGGLDRAVGLERIGQTDAGIVWRVRPRGTAPSRVRIDAQGGPEPVDSTAEGVRVELDGQTQGALVLAERADAGWRARLNGVELAPTTVDGWAQGFSDLGPGTLVVSHARARTLTWQITVLLILALTALAAIPWRSGK